MKTLHSLALFLVLFGLATTRPAVAAEGNPPAREHLRFDAGWRFALGHPSDPTRDFNHATGYFSYLAKAGYGDGPAAANFDDAAWRSVDLPHDWAVELPFNANASSSHGHKAVGRNFPDHNVGWYRKTFHVPATDLGRRLTIQFDGVYRDSSVWVNGFQLGRQPSGYASFHYDLTDYLNYGGDNVLSVRVDASMEEGWFYEGAGIYRHVWLTKTAPLHVAPWGTFVTTTVDDSGAAVAALTTIHNEGNVPAVFDLLQEVVDDTGRSVATATAEKISLGAGADQEIPVLLKVAQPRLWSLETPTLHQLITSVREDGVIVDRYVTSFGIRTIRFDPDHGFFLNGQPVKLKGTNNHQDHAGLGVALPDGVQDFRIAQLKAMGSNAYRASHHPPTPELLDACDRLGMLVIDETRLMGTNPEQLVPLEQMIRRDRNHPSVILWSLGNEEWAIEGNLKGARIATTMQAFARRLDPTRLTTIAISGGWGGISTVIDVMGVNYIKHGDTDKQHANFPQQIIVGTEETTTQGTRGIYFDDREHAHLAPQKEGSSGGNAESGWQYYAARPYLAGVFYWTGFDYRGEMTPFGWPAVGSQFGILDSCGFPKDGFFYLKSWWDTSPVLHVFPHWNWPGKIGQPITVSAHSNHEAVELLLNGQSLGRQKMPVNGHLEWSVPYQPGTLEARGYRGNQLVETTRVETTGPAAGLRLTPHRAQLRADGEDVAMITVAVVDAQGRVVPTADPLVQFALSGPGKILGVGNGDPVSHEPDQYLETYQLLPIIDWTGAIVAGASPTPAKTPATQPLAQLGNWLAPLPKTGEHYDLAGTFTVARTPAVGVKATLFLPSLGAKTSVWLNGRELARDVDTTKAGVALPLELNQLSAGANRVQVIVVPLLDQRNHIPELNRLGQLQLRVPAPTWQRHAFNGLAQIIVQTTAQPGEIELTAQSSGLSAARLTLPANAATPSARTP